MTNNDTTAAIREAMEQLARDFELWENTPMTGLKVASRIRAAAEVHHPRAGEEGAGR